MAFLKTTTKLAAQDEASKTRQQARPQPLRRPLLKDHSAQSPPISHSSKSMKKANQKRCREEAARAQDSSSASLPSPKKPKQNDKYTISTEASLASGQTDDNAATENLQEEDSRQTHFAIAPGLLDTISTYEVTSMNIISSSHIQAKVTRILETLASFSIVAPTKPKIIVLHAKCPVSSKLITIVEIVKREIAKGGGKWYQYNSLDHMIATQEKKSAAKRGTGRRPGGIRDADAMNIDHDKDEEAVDDHESTFERMKTPLERAIDGKPKIRAIPVLTSYLSRVRIESLRETYSEQTNALT